MKRAIVALASVGASSALFALAPAAHAAGTCEINTSYNNNSIAVLCTGGPAGTTQFRGKIQCTDGGIYYGPFRNYNNAYGYSAVGCPGSYTIARTGLSFR